MKVEDSHSNTSELIASLKDQRTSLLVVDTATCPHSARLVNELKVMSTLGGPVARRRTMHVLDLAGKEGKALETLTWLPGVPCLLYQHSVHLGLDAFTKCREIAKTEEGVVMQTLL
jgi:hypothetical protein